MIRFPLIIPTATQDDIIYCDPPYIGRHTDYFNAWTDYDEQDLYSLLAATPARFILSTWHSNKYRVNKMIEKYRTLFDVYTKDHFYHVGASEQHRNPVVEALILNYRPLSFTSLAQESSGVQQFKLAELPFDQ